MTNLQTVLDRAVAQHSIPGAVAMIGNSTQIAASAVSGTSDPATQHPMALDSIFQIASMTKAITSLAAMQSVERGLLSLDDPIGTVLEEFAAPQIVTGFREDGSPELQAAKTAVTLKHLLTHTSGLGYAFTSEFTAKAQGEVAPGSIASITSPLLFEPGSKWHYGTNTDWVGRAIEAVTGTSLGEFLQENIFGPLAMHDTGFSVPESEQHRRVALLSKGEAGYMPFPVEIGGGDAAEFQAGGAGLYSTAPDYMRFMQMVLNNGTLDGHRIIKPETLELMTSNQIGEIRAGAMQSIIPLFANDFDPFPNMNSQWGLGFLINPQQGPHGRAAGSLTWAGIANCYYWIDPKSDIAGLVLMQFLPFADAGALEVLGAVEEAAYTASTGQN